MQATEAQAAFERAIKEGRLSADRHADNFAGRFMFMGRDAYGRDAFKNSLTREYLEPPAAVAVPWQETDRETAYGSSVRLSRAVRVF